MVKQKFILLFFLIFSYSIKAGDLYRAKHDAFIKQVIPEIDKVLILNNVCKSSNDCGKKEILFYAPGRKELYLTLYSVKDLEIIKDVMDRILSTYENNNASTSIEFLAYKEKHAVNVGLFKRLFTKDEPFLTMSIKEK